MKIFLSSLIIPLMIVSNASAGGYNFQKLDEMINDVEYIIIGKVISAKYPFIEVEVIETLAGKINSKRLQLTYFLPDIEDEDGTTYWFDLPGSSIEMSLEVNKEYVLLFKNEDESYSNFELLRAEEKKQRDAVLEAWNKYRKTIQNKK